MELTSNHDVFFHNGEQDFYLVRNVSPSVERMTWIHTANSTGNQGSSAYQMNNGTLYETPQCHETNVTLHGTNNLGKSNKRWKLADAI